MFEGPVRTKSKLRYPSTMIRKASIYSVSFTLARGYDRSRAAVLAQKSQIFPTLCQLAPSLKVAPFELIEKLYGS